MEVSQLQCNCYFIVLRNYVLELLLLDAWVNLSKGVASGALLSVCHSRCYFCGSDIVRQVLRVAKDTSYLKISRRWSSRMEMSCQIHGSTSRQLFDGSVF